MKHELTVLLSRSRRCMPALSLMALLAAFTSAQLLADPGPRDPARAKSHGEVQSRACPFSCKTEGLSKKECRDWQDGTVCFVEDLRRAQLAAGLPPRGVAPGVYDSNTRPQEESTTVDPKCAHLAPKKVGRPSIQVARESKIKPLDGQARKIGGAVEGRCIREAGYYEEGRKLIDIPVTTSSKFKRFEFQFLGERRRKGEIIAYNVLGQSDTYPVDELPTFTR